MSSLKEQIETAVITILNTGSFSLSFTALRGPRSLKKLEETSTLQVIVAAVPTARRRLTRSKIEWQFIVGVGLFKKVGFDDAEEIDQTGLLPIQQLAEEIADALDVVLPGFNANGPLVPEIDYEPDDGVMLNKGIVTVQVNSNFLTWTDRN